MRNMTILAAYQTAIKALAINSDILQAGGTILGRSGKISLSWIPRHTNLIRPDRKSSNARCVQVH